MTSTVKPLALSPELLASMEAVARQAMTKHRDPQAMREAARRMDEIRERIRQSQGVVDLGVPGIREFRDR